MGVERRNRPTGPLAVSLRERPGGLPWRRGRRDSERTETTANSPTRSLAVGEERKASCRRRARAGAIRAKRGLAYPRRREVLGLLDEDPEWRTADIVAHVLDVQEWPNTPTESELGLTLTHRRLPQLAQSDSITLERDATPIRRGGSYRIVRAMADVAASVSIEQ